MRKIKLLPVFLLFLLFFTACDNSQKQKNNQQNPTSSIQPGSITEPSYGGNIVIAISADPINTNPLYIVDQTSFDIQQALYSPFFEIVKGELYYKNGLLESIKPNKDSSKFILKLKKGLKWHDGKDITAKDIVFTMNTLVDKSQNVPYQSYGYVNGKPVVTKEIDKYTVSIKLPASFAGFLGGLSQIYCIPEHIYKGVANIGESTLNHHPIGSGPFQFEEYKPGESFTVKRFENYFDGKAYLDKIIFKIIKDTNSANASLASTDIHAKLISSEDYSKVEANGKVNIYTYASGRVNVMGFNQNNEILRDVRVRQAIAYALNKKELVDFSFLSSAFASPAYSVFSPDTLFYQDNLLKYDNNIEQAKILLQEAGQSQLKLNILYIATNKTMESQAIYIKEKLAQIGIELELYPMEESSYKNKILEEDTKDYDLLLQFYTLGEEPSLYGDIIRSNSRTNYSHVKDNVLDSLWEKGNNISDETKRKEIYQKIQTHINDNMYIYPIAYPKGFYAVNKQYGGFEDVLLKTIYYDYSKIYKIQ